MPRSRLDAEVSALLDSRAHPLRAEIDALRAIVLATDPDVVEGVKWNTASFRTTEWFATLNGPKHTKEPMLVLHGGAKAKGANLRARVADPTGMVRWLGNDRGIVTFADRTDITKRRAALLGVLRSWIAAL